MSVARAVRIMQQVLPKYTIDYDEEFPDHAFIAFEDMPEEGADPRVDAAMERITFRIADKGYLLTGVKEDIKEDKQTMKSFMNIVKENSADEQVEHPDHVAAATMMQKLCAEMRDVVHEMRNCYEANEFLNEIQPDGFSRMIPMSLDEWHHRCMDLVWHWEKVAKKEPIGDDE